MNWFFGKITSYWNATKMFIDQLVFRHSKLKNILFNTDSETDCIGNWRQFVGANKHQSKF